MIAQIDSAYIRARPWKFWSRLVSYALFEGRPLTTRGRWINPLVFTHFAIEKRLPALRKVENPIFILGTGRSGTTILGIILSMHRDVGFLNEPKALWHAIYPKEDLIGSYCRNGAQYRLNACDVSHAVVQSAHRIYGAYLSATFSRRVVDKYPELIFRVPFVKTIFPDAKFLFLTRNGWDTCHSISHWSDRLGQRTANDTHDWWGVNRQKWNLLMEGIIPEHKDLAPYTQQIQAWTKHTDMAATEWIVTMREGLSLLKQFPDDVLQVHYETLCQAPQQSMNKIIQFLELSEGDLPFLQYAESTLQPTTNKKHFELNQLIKEPFLNTMRDLGYE